MTTLIQEKIAQAIDILTEHEIDLWLTFVRETSASADPVLPFIYGAGDLTWQSALILSRSGERIAIVGRYDAEAVKTLDVYTTIIPYDEGIKTDLLEILSRLNPQQIALNYSRNDVKADGLSYGLFQVLRDYLQETPYAERLTSAEGIINALRSRKTATEIERIKAAIQTTHHIYQKTFDYVQAGMAESEISDFMLAQVDERALKTSWSREACPIINAGPDTPLGHVGASNIRIKRGQLLHFDFGLTENDYSSDLQRVIYFLEPGETEAPPLVQRAFEVVRYAIEEAVRAMKPGMLGKEVDAVGRGVIVDAGYPEYKFATGHHLGREAHDGGGVLGPEWERYGDTPNYPLEANHVYAVELGVMVPGYGYMALEENVLVTETETIYLGTPQTALILK